MKTFVRIDVSLASSALRVLDEHGRILQEAQVASEPEAFVEYLRSCPSQSKLILYGIGNMVGPHLGGRLMDFMGPNGFFVAVGGVKALYGLYALCRSMRTAAIHPSLRPDFQISPVLPTTTPKTLKMNARTADEVSIR